MTGDKLARAEGGIRPVPGSLSGQPFTLLDTDAASKRNGQGLKCVPFSFRTEYVPVHRYGKVGTAVGQVLQTVARPMASLAADSPILPRSGGPLVPRFFAYELPSMYKYPYLRSTTPMLMH